MRRELENNKRRKESAGLSYLGNTCRDKQPGGSNKQKERERKRGWDLRGGKKGKPNGSYGGGARYHKTKMTLFSLPFFCFCATTATTPLRHSSSSSSVVAAAPAVPSSCCSHFLDFRSLNFSSISGKFRFLLGLPGVSCSCFLFSSLFFSFLFVSVWPILLPLRKSLSD